MRVIAGRFRSRTLQSLPGLDVRPTPDRLRESLFNILAPRIQGAVFLDVFAGTGAVGIEALSRGASRVILIERNTRALEVLRENVKALRIGDEVTIVRGNAITLLQNYKTEIAFIDPPYDAFPLYEESFAELLKSDCELVIAQHFSGISLKDQFGRLKKSRVVKQGSNSLSFYEPGVPESSAK